MPRACDKPIKMKATLYVFERRSDCLGHVKFTAEFLHLITLPTPDQSVLIYNITYPITSMTYMYIRDEDCIETPKHLLTISCCMLIGFSDSAVRGGRVNMGQAS